MSGGFAKYKETVHGESVIVGTSGQAAGINSILADVE